MCIRDRSLSEIAEEFGISRQGVHDALKNGEKALNEYEEKLGLVEKFQRSSDAVKRIDTIIDGVIRSLQSEDGGDRKRTAEKLREVKDIIDKLEE